MPCSARAAASPLSASPRREAPLREARGSSRPWATGPRSRRPRRCSARRGRGGVAPDPGDDLARSTTSALSSVLPGDRRELRLSAGRTPTAPPLRPAACRWHRLRPAGAGYNPGVRVWNMCGRAPLVRQDRQQPCRLAGTSRDGSDGTRTRDLRRDRPRRATGHHLAAPVNTCPKPAWQAGSRRKTARAANSATGRRWVVLALFWRSVVTAVAALRALRGTVGVRLEGDVSPRGGRTGPSACHLSGEPPLPAPVV